MRRMAERVLISLEDITLSYGGKPLFEELRIHIGEGDKVCLIGKNGAGKTTLMKLITGELDVDAGARFAMPGITVGYLAQSVAFDREDTVKAFVLSGLAQQDQTEARHHLADIMMEPLDLNGEAVMGTLSGGQLRRAALARALVSEPDVLLLDEPTNHLDLTAIEWLEQYLSAYRGALVCVSHDRAFLKAVSKKVFWIDRGRIRVCPGGYAGFEEWQEAIVEQEARELQNMQKKLAAEVDWTQGGVTGRRKRNIRRLNELFRLRDKLKGEKAAHAQRLRHIELEQMSPQQASKVIVEFKQVSKAFGEGRAKVVILDDFNLRITRGDRIGIIGKNGSGKSTFIKLLTGELEPDSGFVKRGKTIEIAYFDQNRVDLNPNKTLWDTLCPNGGDYVFLGGGDKPTPIHVCGYLKNFLFDPRVARDRVSTLSGGQQNRLLLAKLLSNPGNVLILDEPTNDLDMDTLDMLQEMLADYEGTLIIVSHDRDFLDRTVTEVLAFEGETKVQAHIGGYSDYLTDKLARNKVVKPLKNSERNGGFTTPLASIATDAPKPAAKTKMSFKFVHELEKLPGKIAALEKDIAAFKAALGDADLYIRDPKQFDSVSRKLALAQHDLEVSELRWLELDEMRQASGQ